MLRLEIYYSVVTYFCTQHTIHVIWTDLYLYVYNMYVCLCVCIYLQQRVSGVLSNSPYILVLDCDMYCNDPTVARKAMCFHLDPNITHSLAFVQFPQIFRNISKDDIYASQLRSIFKVCYRCMTHANSYSLGLSF